MNYDRDVEMAATKVFRDVRQRFCRRDIFSNCKERLATGCVNKLEGIDEFESTWRLLLNKYNLSGNEWLQTIYNIHHQWVPVYLKDSFFSEMLNAPKPETMLKSLRRNFIATSLPDLVMQFDRAILRHHQNELQKDFASFCHKMVMKTPYPMEKQASELYTRLIFSLFQDELVGSSEFSAQKVGHIIKFEVTKYGIANKRYTVIYNEPGNSITCSCHKFEFAGILFAEEGATSAEIYKIAKEALVKAFAETYPERKLHSK
ncbi:hypothetical protein U9M48_004349 [Paspalum notatum var. saurae]|uniref:Protein FAR1-RELATED SEQUENCE n=1 Tax=Paspalum notatum var. saurae TaxID=547442 RepID=A0AAQ3SL99_PASNO